MTGFCNHTHLIWWEIFPILCILYYFDSLLFVSGYCSHDAVNDYYGCNAGQACIQGNAEWWYQGSCVTCSIGYYCEGGYHKFTTSNGSPALMEPCPINTYLATTGADDSTDCTDCATGTFSDAASTSTADCTDQCSVGKYKSESGTSCIDCPAGTYRASRGATSISDCAPCVAGKYSSIAGATTCSEKCASNTYSESTGATSSSVCLACATGKYSLTGSTSCASGCSYGTLLTDGTGEALCLYAPFDNVGVCRTAARSSCESNGGWLVSIRNAAQNSIVCDYIGDDMHIIGYEQSSSIWTWDEDDTVGTYTNWNIVDHDTNAVMYGSVCQWWSVEECRTEFVSQVSYVCQYPFQDEPTGQPSSAPSSQPSAVPSAQPSDTPSAVPTATPVPTPVPTEYPTSAGQETTEAIAFTVSMPMTGITAAAFTANEDNKTRLSSLRPPRECST